MIPMWKAIMRTIRGIDLLLAYIALILTAMLIIEDGWPWAW